MELIPAEDRREAPDEKSTANAQTLMRGLDILEALAERSLGLSELSSRIGLPRTTTHRLAGALVERGMLTSRPGEGYCLGPNLLSLGYAAGRQIQMTVVAHPHIEALSATTGDAVHFGILAGGEILYLDKVAGSRRVSIVSRIGERQPVASTALGKALVLDMTEAQWRDFFPRGRDGAQDEAALAAWLERMRTYAQGGYASDLEENEDQIRCLGAPVRGVDGAIVGAISLSSAAQYMDGERMQALTPLVQATANNISRELGWSQRAPRAG